MLVGALPLVEVLLLLPFELCIFSPEVHKVWPPGGELVFC